MTQLAQPIPPIVTEIRATLAKILDNAEIRLVDADSETTGRDFLLKIWHLIIGVPAGIAIVHEGISDKTLANIFYELGLMQAYGKETIIIKAGNATIPSDLIRTEYASYDNNFERRMRGFLKSLMDRSNYYRLVADQVERNPLLSIDYLRRAYLLTGDETLRERARVIHAQADIPNRAANSVEALLASF